MTVDFHTHIYPDHIAEKAVEKLTSFGGVSAFCNGTEKSLFSSMETAEVDVSIILPVATNPEKCRSMNRFALEINEKYKNAKRKLLSFAAVHPAAPDVKALIKEIAEQGFKGIKLHPDYQDLYFDDPLNVQVLKEAERYGLITVVHSGYDCKNNVDIRCTPQRVLHVLEQIQPEKLVLAHMGGNSMWYDVSRTLCGKGIYFDTAFVNGRIQTEDFVKLVELNGEEKILFGSDSPWDDQKEDVDFIKKLPLSEGAINNILSGNAVKLLGL